MQFSDKAADALRCFSRQWLDNSARYCESTTFRFLVSRAGVHHVWTMIGWASQSDALASLRRTAGAGVAIAPFHALRSIPGRRGF